VSDAAANLEAVRERIRAAAARAGRDPAGVQLVAVTKTFGADRVREAAAAGQRVFGENKVQEALTKIDQLRDLDLEWHLIGHLQSNKARRAAAAFRCLETIDRLDLLRRVDAGAAEANVRPRVLIQVDLAHEATKSGADETDVPELVRAALGASALDLVGLMIVPPYPERAEDSRPWFRRLRELRDRIVAAGCPAERMRELSMGMSIDFEVAIEEGATMVRVGTALFGKRKQVSDASGDGPIG
jgi:pyridoxal phosphate enzyme (YggS family)